MKLDYHNDLRSTLLYGPMKSGKSERLIEIAEQFYEQKIPFLTFKPSQDSRDGKYIKSRNPKLRQIESISVSSAAEIRKWSYQINKGKNKFFREVQKEQNLEEEAKNVLTIREYMTSYSNPLKVILIDEIFLFDSGIVKVIDELTKRDIKVIAAGLLTDFRRKFFPLADFGQPLPNMPTKLAEKTMEHVMDKFDVWEFLFANCEVCGKPAEYTQRFTNNKPSALTEPVVQIGDAEYQARCFKCYKEG